MPKRSTWFSVGRIVVPSMIARRWLRSRCTFVAKCVPRDAPELAPPDSSGGRGRFASEAASDRYRGLSTADDRYRWIAVATRRQRSTPGGATKRVPRNAPPLGLPPEHHRVGVVGRNLDHHVLAGAERG